MSVTGPPTEYGDKTTVPGVLVGVWDGKGGEWVQEIGMADLNAGRPMTRADHRAGSGCLDRFPRTISGVLPGLLSLPHRGWDEGRA